MLLAENRGHNIGPLAALPFFFLGKKKQAIARVTRFFFLQHSKNGKIWFLRSTKRP
jgi:hypothetical protein